MARARRVAVVGGGWAGLAAAVQSRLLGAEVIVFEMAAHWGGRARRIDVEGTSLDNGQHIMIGAYRETLRLMREVGVDLDAAFLRTPLRLLAPDGEGLALPSGSPIASFARGVLGHRAWSWRERWTVLGAASGWAARGFRCAEHASVDDLSRHLPAHVKAELIEPLCVAALNTPAREASGRVFLRVLRDALFSGRGSADLLLPRWRLSDMFPTPAVHWLAAQGAALRSKSRVERLVREGGHWQLDGETADQVIIATTAVEAARLVQPVSAAWAAQAQAMSYEPIVTVYAHSEGTRLPEPMFALSWDEQSRPAQFVFDLGQLGAAPGMLAFVISGARPWVELGLPPTEQLTLTQGTDALRSHLRSPLQLLRTLTEKRATFRCVPQLARPPARIAPGLMAAGDYVEGPYPATLEGAVRSGVQAARALAESA